MKQDVSATSTQGGSPNSSRGAAPESERRLATKRDTSATSTQGGSPEPSPNGLAVAPPDTGTTSHNLYMPPSTMERFVSVPDGWIRWMSWPTLFFGDCRMEGALLHLYPDGMIFFQANTISSDDDDVDVWIIRSMQFSDEMHRPVGHALPKHVGMQMAWQGSAYPFTFWDSIPGVTPTGAAQIRNGSMTYSC
ncbi:MAG TPA: hypothetical protein VIS29_14565 [Streptomyces sp.]